MSHEIAETDQNELTRLRAELEATRADLDTLRNDVAWLGTELDRAKRWAALWKRAATRHWINAWRLEGILRGERARRQDTDAALLDMQAQPETEHPPMRYTSDEIAEIARLTGWHLGTDRPAITPAPKGTELAGWWYDAAGRAMACAFTDALMGETQFSVEDAQEYAKRRQAE